MINRKPSAVAAAVLLVAGLAGCTVSDEEKAHCETILGGEIVSEKYPFKDGFFGSDSGRLYTCSDPSGAILEVYNDQVTQVDTGFFGDNKDNRQVFTECTAAGGETYDTTKTQKVGKTTVTKHYFLCVQDGRVIEIKL